MSKKKETSLSSESRWGDYPKWYAGWNKDEIITKFEDNKSYLKALGRERK